MHRMHYAFLAIIVATALPAAASAPPQEAKLRHAFALAKSGELGEPERHDLRRNPLLPWLEALQFKQHLSTQTSPQALILSNPQDPANLWLIGQWRNELIRRQDWPAAAQWLTLYPDNNAGSQCAHLLATGAAERDAVWQQQALTLWKNESRTPAHCAMVFDTLQQAGALDTATVWQRFDRMLADDAKARLPEVIAVMSPADATIAMQYQRILDDPLSNRAGLPQDLRSARVLQESYRALARKDATLAEHMLGTDASQFPFTTEQRNAIHHDIALWSLVNNLPEAEARYQALPEAERSANLREWYMRYQFGINDDSRTLAAFAQLLPAQQQDARWQYFKGRILERLGNRDAAMQSYTAAAQTASFHGWLAAEHLGEAYRFCPLEQSLSRRERHALYSQHPGLERALWLWQLGETNYAIWEWNAVFNALNSDQQREAIALAQDVGWFDRAVFSLAANALNQRYYHLRFATPYRREFTAASERFALDRSWLMAHARAESVFMPNVTSSANARGLLQLLPSTAETIAAQNGIDWQGADSLYQPEVNILLGAGALHDMIGRYDGKAYLAIGAYNAGPTAVNRWLAARSMLDADFWIETIPYPETREYIPRVLSFAVIYDWLLKQPVTPLSRRLSGDFNTDDTPVALRCPPAATEKKKPR